MIREAMRDEIPACADVIRRSFRTVADEFGFTRENAPRFTAFALTDERLLREYDGGNRPTFVCERDGVLCGCYSLLLGEDGACELNHLAVLPEFRRRGIGTRLFRHAAGTARRYGCRVMTFGIVEENTVLRAWYEKNGAAHTGTKKFDFFPFTCGYMEIRL